MKRIIKLGYNRYIHLDSYGESHETRGGNFVVAILAILMASITVGAMLSIDITQFNQQQNYEQSR